MRRTVFIIVFLFGLSSISQADTVLFKNGDRLTGKLISIIKKKISFKPEITGEVTFNLSDVQNFWTDDKIKIHLKDGTTLQRRVFKSETGHFAIQGTDILVPQTFAFDDLASVNPLPVPKVKFKGNITAGLTSTHGNSFSESGSISFNLSRQTKNDRAKIAGIYLSNRTRNPDTKETKTTEESILVGGKYDYFLTKKLYSYLNCSYKKDRIADLDRRIITGVGAGYQLLDVDKIKFSLDAGIAHLFEKYITKNSVTNEKETDSTGEISLQLGYQLDSKLNDKIIFLHNLVYLPSLEGKFSDYFLHTNAELRLSLTKSMFSSFKTIMDYDSTPAEDCGCTDVKYIFGLGWNF